MAKNFEQLRAQMSPKARESSASEHRRLVEEMSLLQLRKARDLTQAKLAEELHMGQATFPNSNRAPTCTCARSPVIFRQWARTWRSAHFSRMDAP